MKKGLQEKVKLVSIYTETVQIKICQIIAPRGHNVATKYIQLTFNKEKNNEKSEKI